ncbi:MAG: NDP-sugar synthase [Dehalococcoidales bacterium]|nr:NDP-sugar synthase [Dehalococcoidales bacterium]
MKKSISPHGLKAVILVGGPGMRLRPLTDNCPKPIVPVVNKPFLEHTLTHLKLSGIADIILAMSYLPEAIRDYFGDGERFGVRLTYCIEEEPMGTAGAVKNAAAYLDGPFVVLNGDNVFLEIDFKEVYAFHRDKKAKATIFTTWVDDPSAFGVVEMDADQRVKRFIEKPPPGTETSNWINAGGYILEPEVLEEIPAGKHYMFEKGLFPRLLEIGRHLYGYTYKGYWLDMGAPQKYFNFNMDLLLKKTKSPLLQNFQRDGVYYSGDSEVHPAARITGPVLVENGCKIGPGVSVKGPVVIGKGCVIGDGAGLEKTILWDNVNIGKNSSLEKCIVSGNTIIKDGSKIENSVVTPSKKVPLFV